MNFNKTLKLFLCLLLLAISDYGWAQSIYLPHYTTKNGLPSNNCFYTLEDKKGYIWIATDAGVSRFDGAVFENFSVDNGLPDNQILQLREDSKGRIWFLSLNGQLSYFLNGRIYNQGNDKQLQQLNFNAVVVSFYEDSKGNIWFGTNKNVIGCWNGKILKKFQSSDLNRQFINAYLTEDSEGNIWAYTAYGNFRFINNSFVLSKDALLSLSYKTFKRNKDKSVFFLAKNGLYLKKGSTNQFISHVNQDLLNSSVGYIHADEKQLLLANNTGIHIIKHSGDAKRLLKDVDVNQAVRDRNNNIWFTTKNGVYRLPEDKERLYIVDREKGLSNNSVNSVTKDADQNLWMGLSMGTINVLNTVTKQHRIIDIPDKKSYSNIKQLVIDQKSKVLYFSSDYGLGSFSTTAVKPTISYLKETNNSIFVIKNFSLDSTSKLALSLSSGVVILNNREELKFSSLNYKEKQDFFADRSYCVFYDNHQTLWFSNIYGLSAFVHNTLSKSYTKSTLLTKRINDIKQLAGGKLALATDGYGILIFHKGSIVKQITTENGLNNNIINKLFVKDDYLWAISNTGINRLNYKQKNIEANSFDYANDLLSDDLNDLYIDKDTAYFATNNGLVYFLHSQNTTAKNKLQVYISSIINNKLLVDVNVDRFSLAPGEHNIVFNYSAIDFKNRKIVYRYRLKQDAGWTETKNRRLELSSLAPGNYCFEVSAKTQDGQWTAPAKINFVLEEYFWQTKWFLGMAIAVGAYILYKVTVTITRQQKNKEQEQLLLKNKVLMLEQKALQAMMSPHFIFNVMNSIQHYINTKNTSSANKVLTGFAKLIRKNLDIITRSYISLEEETAYLNLYLSLEKYRFGDKLNYSISIDEDLDKEEILIPTMLLQPYIENAIWHGIMPKEDGGEITVEICRGDENYLLIKITDDGIGINNALKHKNNTHESKGMTLTADRIALLNKIEAKPIQYDVKQNGNTGTTITLSIPI